MAKKVVRENWRVEVTPEAIGYGRSNEGLRADCESIAKSIRRHVDEVGSVNVECDTKIVCEFCGCDWEHAADDDGELICCTKAAEEQQAAKAAKGKTA